jgi:fructose/tagatose bisphosphate aldolase
VRLTRATAELAHQLGACVEGELGQVSRNLDASREELAGLMTDPEEAARFVERTGVDYLAVSVGSVSGFFRGRIDLDLERLEQIARRVSVPLVFHGGTSIPDEQVRQAVRLGVAKINIAHGVRKAFWDGVSATAAGWDTAKPADPRVMLDGGRKAAAEFVRRKMLLLRGTHDQP